MLCWLSTVATVVAAPTWLRCAVTSPDASAPIAIQFWFDEQSQAATLVAPWGAAMGSDVAAQWARVSPSLISARFPGIAVVEIDRLSGNATVISQLSGSGAAGPMFTGPCQLSGGRPARKF